MRDNGLVQEDMERQAGRAASLALEAIGRLVAKRSAGAERVLDHLLKDLMTASYAPDEGGMGKAIAQMRTQNVSDEMIVTQYIPEAARLLGRAWEGDELSFVDVTVGTSRLVDAVDRIGCHWLSHETDDPGTRSVLLLVPPGEQHTLGVTILACQMRQEDVSVCLRFAPSLTELAALLEGRKFAGAMISVATSEKIDSCAVLVKALHTLSKGSLPVAVGGAVVGVEPDLAARTGAELVTSSLTEVASHFGLGMKQKT